jgi:hypothetical protein
MMDKATILRWSRKYDKDQGWWAQKEIELGARLRRTKVLTLDDLTQVVQWKFQGSEEKMKRVLEAVSKNDAALVARISSQVFNVPTDEDAFRMNSLTMLNGVSPVIASVILTFFDPKNYGVFDVQVWKALLGNEPPNLFTTQNYLKLLAALRKTASKNNLDARIVEKAFFKKNLDESK